MGLFDKREKIDFNKASGTVFVMSVMIEGRMSKIELNGVEKNHELIVRCGYVFGLSIALLGTQIGMNNINTFINYAIKNASAVLNPNSQKDIQEYEKYIRKATSWILNESSKYGKNLFEEYAKVYLNDLYDGKEYPKDMLSIATQDMIFYYGNWKNFESGIKIVK